MDKDMGPLTNQQYFLVRIMPNNYYYSWDIHALCLFC